LFLQKSNRAFSGSRHSGTAPVNVDRRGRRCSKFGGRPAGDLVLPWSQQLFLIPGWLRWSFATDFAAEAGAIVGKLNEATGPGESLSAWSSAEC